MGVQASPMVDVVVVRAGRTCWDETQRVQGRTDLPLTDQGRADVLMSLAQHQEIMSERLAVVYTGPDEASEQTAALVAEAFGGRAKTLRDLVGVDFGLWHGLTEAELSARCSRSWERWVADPTSVTPPGGETMLEVQERVRSGLRRVVAKAASKPTAVVLRPLQFAMLKCWLEGKGMCSLWSLAHELPPVERVRMSADRLAGTTVGV